MSNVTARVYKDGEGTAVLLTDEAKKRLDAIGTTPIVSKEYIPSCMVSYTAGLIRIMKTARWTNDDFITLVNLIRCAHCVDKGVITEVIDFGIYHTISDYDTAKVVTKISYDMILQASTLKNWCVLSDTQIAFAIRAGLVEMCLSIMGQFAMHESFKNDEQSESFGNVEHITSLSHNIASIFKHVYSVSLHMKSAKAIRSRKNCIRDKLMQLGQNKEISSIDKCKELLNMVRSVLDLNNAYCTRCNKSLGKKEIKRCNGCNRMTYCSKACQREDWLNGHNLTCCEKHYTDEQAGQFQGRIWPVREPESERAAAKLEALEQNFNMIQLKLFFDNSGSILRQARSLAIPLYDCVVHFDLRDCPPTVEVMRYTEHFEQPERIKCFEDTRSRENITCIYISSIFNGELLASGVSPFMAMQRFYPQEWLSKKL